MGHNSTTALEKFIVTSLRNTISEPKIQQTKIVVTNSLDKAETVYEGRLKVILLLQVAMTYLPL